MEQQIRFCTSSDGTRIAYATVGQGPAVIRIRPWFTHLEFEWENPILRFEIDRLSARHLLIRHDGRGTGLSDHQVNDYSPEAQVRDLEAVVDALGLERFALYGQSQGGATAITYTVRYPERVSHLILVGAFARMGWFIDTEEGQQLFQTALSLIRQGWGTDLPAYRQFFTSLFMPDADAEAIHGFNEFQRISASPENAAAVFSALPDTDVSGLLSQVRAPTLVIHCRGDAIVPFEAGRELAACITGARFLPLDSRNHAMLPHEPAAEVLGKAVEEFLAEGEEPTAGIELPEGMAVLLFADIAESTALTEKLGDAAFRAKARGLDMSLWSVIRESRGTPVEGKVLGDGVLAVFTSARQAIDCALRCRAASQPLGLQLHLGIHAGDVIREGNNVYGGAVNIAARIAAASEPGEVLVSDTVRSLARTSVGVRFEDRGERQMKGISEPVRLYRVSESTGGDAPCS